MPSSMAYEKARMPSPPNPYMMATATRVVPEVMTVRLMVWLMDRLTTSALA